MKTRVLEICGAPLSDFDRCERLLAEGECCPEHPASDGVFVEYEVDAEWMLDREEIAS